MLSPAAYSLLASPSTISDPALRFFLRLLAQFDLHGYRAIDPQLLAKDWGISAGKVRKYLHELLQLKLLKSGPTTTHPRGRTGGVGSYRVNPTYWLTKDESEEGDRVLERESLLVLG